MNLYVYSPTLGEVCVQVDEEDFEFSQRVCVVNVARKGRTPKLYAKVGRKYLHRILLGATQGQYVDHINGDSLDNRKANLRIVTHAQNQQNRHKPNRNNKSGIKGVYWNTRWNRWEAKYMRNRKSFWLGSYPTKEAAETALLRTLHPTKLIA